MSDSQQQQQQLQQQQTSQEVDSTLTENTANCNNAIAPRPAKAVLTAEEIGRMVDLGLGRGIDATNPTPWLMKSSFQVRNCTIENTIGTEEGGSLQSYEREVSSVHSHQTNLKTSVTNPQAPLHIGLDAEQSRSFSTTRKVVGKKVINRTISFRTDFVDLPTIRTVDPNEAKLSSVENLTRGIYRESKSAADIQNSFTFEERLCKWIIEGILQRQSLQELQLKREGKTLPLRRTPPGVNPVTDLASFFHKSTSDERREIVKDCSAFVHTFHITHYVSAIQLGAAQYRVFSETEYYSRIGATGTLGIEAFANSALSENMSHKTTKKASDVRQIGVIGSNGRVERGSYDEAVVGIQIQPISSLLQLRYLELAMRRALLTYIGAQGDTSGRSLEFFEFVKYDRNACMTQSNAVQSCFDLQSGERAFEF